MDTITTQKYVATKGCESAVPQWMPQQFAAPLATSLWGEAAPLSIPPAPVPSLAQQAAQMSCEAMTELAKQEVINQTQTLLYSVNAPGQCNNGYRDWSVEYDLLAGGNIGKRKQECFIAPDGLLLGEWVNVNDDVKKPVAYNINTSALAPSQM